MILHPNILHASTKNKNKTKNNKYTKKAYIVSAQYLIFDAKIKTSKLSNDMTYDFHTNFKWVSKNM